ncbi:unnamed protein product [Musa hybrid cultivar]
MSCFPCFNPRRREVSRRIEDSGGSRSHSRFVVDASESGKKASSVGGERSKSARKFTFRDLATATQNFKEANLIGEGGFGRVFKGRLDSGQAKQVLAIKQLKQDGLQGSKEFLVEVLMLTVLRHPNLVSLIGYCAEGDERLLVYEFMPKGSLEDHLFDLSPQKPPLEWNTRIRIALGAAKGLTYLHDVASPPVIYRDMKAANILLDNNFNPKLSDFGLAKLGPVGDKTHVSTRVMGTYGYCAPDYVMSGKLTPKSDIYSFGVLLLELITGRRAFDYSRTRAEQNLVTWSRPFLNDRRKFLQLADPSLRGHYPPRAFHQLVVITSMCLQEQAHVRPIIADVVVALDHVASQPYTAEPNSKVMNSPPSLPSGNIAGTASSRGCSVGKETSSRLVMGNCFETPAQAVSPTDTRIPSPGRSTTRTTGSDITATTGKLSTISNSSLGQSIGSSVTIGDAYPEGRILEAPNLVIFTFAELRSATRNFKPDSVLGEGGFGRVYKGWVDEKTLNPTKSGIGMIVAVKKLNPESLQGLEEWQSEVNFLGRLSHPNLVRLLGYCWEEKELLLVYEYMAKGSLENHLFRKGKAYEPLSWDLRMKIAIGAARGLAFLHLSEKQVIYRDFKASNILLDANFVPKLSDFGLAKNGPTGGQSHVTTRVMGTYGYAAPEYVATGHLYVKSDVYGFGVVLLEMLSGLRALDTTRPSGHHNLGRYPSKAAQQAAQLTVRCLAGDPKSRPSMKEVVETLEHIEVMTSRPREKLTCYFSPLVATDTGSRRALRDINNLVGAAPPCAYANRKRGMPDKGSVDDQNPTFVTRLPMTRKFAATLERKSQAYQQGTKEQHEQVRNEIQYDPPLPSTVSSSTCFDGCTAIDVDDCNMHSDIALPMVDEMEEVDTSDLKEIEMEDLVIETAPDIDSCDSNNPLAVVEYVEDIYSFYRQTEVTSCVSPDYMSRQFDINEKMRAILVDWLIEVHYKFEPMEETLFLTVNIIDRFLARMTVARKKLQLVGVTAMLLACKYEELSVPMVEDFVLITDRAYTREEILEMERSIINTLQFNLSVPTPYVFMRRFLKAAESDRKLELVSFFIIELCLVEYKMLKFQPSLLAAAAIYTAQCSLRGFKCWTKTSELHTSYSEEQLLECSRLMVEFHHKAGQGKLTVVHRKYSSYRYGYAAKSEPALFFLLDTGH